MNTHISPAQPLDAGAVGAILSKATDAAMWLPRIYSRAQELKFASDMIDAGWVQVARADGRIAGFLARAGGEVHCLYLARDVQGQGLGRDLLDTAKATQTCLGLWVYQDNIAAQGFYRAMGFVETTRTNGAANDAGLPDIRFEWRKEVM